MKRKSKTDELNTEFYGPLIS